MFLVIYPGSFPFHWHSTNANLESRRSPGATRWRCGGDVFFVPESLASASRASREALEKDGDDGNGIENLTMVNHPI